MPRRLRVAFPATQFLTLQAASGTFSVTGKTAGLNYVTNAVIADTWTKLSTVLTVGDSRSGPYIGQGWTRAAMNTNTGMPFLAQGNPSQGAQFGNFFFNPSLGYWVRTNVVYDDWHRDPLGIMENYDITYNWDDNKFHRTSGGPFGGTPYNSAGPFYGDSEYNVNTDEWSTPYPASDNTYVALPADVGYFGTDKSNCLLGADSATKYYNGYVYQFGGLSVGGRQDLKRRNLATGVITTLIPYTSGPPWQGVNRSAIYLRAGFDSRTKQLYVLANNLQYWSCDIRGSTFAWEYKPTTGTVGTPAPSAYPTYTEGDFGIVAVIDEAANCMVAWAGTNGTVGADGGTTQRKTWIMDLATRAWRDGPSLAGGHTVPPASTAVITDLLYDPVGKRTILVTGQGFPGTEVWALQIAPIGGKITSWPLPSKSGNTYGVNYYAFPYLANGASKHTNMAHCPLNNRIYVTGGDTAYSATDGTWSMSLDDGSWRLDVGNPVYPTLPAPHAYQDGCLFVWMPSRQKFLFGFGGCFGYEADGNPIYNYSAGYWMFDPIANTWTQLSGFFTNPSLLHFTGGTGNEYGGTYDEVTDTVYVLGDNSSGASARRYNIATSTQDSSIAYTIPSSGIPGFTAAYFIQSRQCQLGRYIYALGVYTNGVDASPANCKPLLIRWGIDDHSITKLTPPPDFTTTVSVKELVLCVSHGKLVHPRRYGPDGAMPEGVYIYNPANDTWTQDTKTPAYGAWIQNSVCSLSDGRVAMSGGVFGAQMTHMWFYEAT